MDRIPYGKQHIDSNDLKIVNQSLKASLITTGSYVLNFEKKLKKYLGSKYVLSCNSGTSAIHLAMMAAKIKQGDNIIMPSVNFVASGNIAKILNANISSCNIKDQTTIKLLDATEMPLNSDEAFNLVFLDPPYRRSLGESAIRSALASNWLSYNALIVLEEGEKKNYLEGFVLEDVRTYRDTILHFFRRVPN